MQAPPKSAVSTYYICGTIPYVFSHINSFRPLLILGSYQVHVLNDSCASPPISRVVEDLSLTFLQIVSDA